MPTEPHLSPSDTAARLAALAASWACWKEGHFALEAKAFALGASARDDALLRRAFGQVRNYVAHVPGDAPP